MNETKALNKLLARVIVQENGCWEWQGARIPEGYGCICGTNGLSKMESTHRLSWRLFYGPIPNGILVLHKCDNPPCCNPDHLFLGTHGDNARDRSSKKRGGIGERNGNAKLSNAQVRELRLEYKAKRGDVTKLAKKFGVSIYLVASIVQGSSRMIGVDKIDWIAEKVCMRGDLTGQVFGRLTVIGPDGKKGRNACSLCRCKCGVEKVLMNFNLISGGTVSCGCYSRDNSSRANSERCKKLEL